MRERGGEEGERGRDHQPALGPPDRGHPGQHGEPEPGRPEVALQVLVVRR